MLTLKTFAGRKADKEDSSDAWTVEDMLRELLAQIESGEWQPTRALLLWVKDGEDGEEDHGWWAAHVSSTKEDLWMCEVHKLERMLKRI